MAVYRNAGESIAGEKILCAAGAYTQPNAAKGQNASALSQHVWAKVVKALRVSTGNGRAESDTLICRSARATADKIDPYDQKIPISGAHRGWKIYLRGNAKCEINTPEEWM
jgi:hypothetical protein